MKKEQMLGMLEQDIKIAGLWNVQMFISTQDDIGSFDGEFAGALSDGDLHELLEIPDECEEGFMIIDFLREGIAPETLVALIQQPVKHYHDNSKSFYSSGWGHYQQKWIKGDSLEEIYNQAAEGIK